MVGRADGWVSAGRAVLVAAHRCDRTRGLVASSFLRRTGWVVEISDMRRQPAKYQELVLPPSIESMRAWLIVPLLTGEELIGFVVLANPRIRVEIDWEVLDPLKTAGQQASSYLAYAMAADTARSQ